MVIDILGYAQNKTNPDPIKNDRECWKSGNLVAAVEDANWGAGEAWPEFFKVTIVDASSLEDVVKYVKRWERKVLYQILEHEPTQDFFRVKLFSNPDLAGTNPKAVIRKAEMEAFLLKWGAEPIVDIDGGIQFEITAWDALYGTGYVNFGSEEEYIEFTKQSYDIVNGTYVVLMDYSSSSINTKDGSETTLLNRGCRVISNNVETGQLVFETDRATMIGYLEEGVRTYFDKAIARSQYSFPESVYSIPSTVLTFAAMEDILIDAKEQA